MQQTEIEKIHEAMSSRQVHTAGQSVISSNDVNDDVHRDGGDSIHNPNIIQASDLKNMD